MTKNGNRILHHRILLIEDSPEGRKAVVEMLEKEGYQVVTVVDCDEAIESVEEWPRQYDAVVIDESIDGGKGLNLLHAVRVRSSHLPVLVVSRDGKGSSCTRALAEGAMSYLSFPLNSSELRKDIHRMMDGSA